MLITSYSFLAFAGGLLLLYYLIPKRAQWGLLLAASYLFYAFSGIKYLAYILATTVVTYLIGCKIGDLRDHQDAFLKEHKALLSREEKKDYKANIKKKQQRWLIAALLFNFGILAVIKYGNFVITNVAGLFGVTSEDPFLRLALPLGISFYTFQTTGYLIDLFRAEYKPERNFFKFSLFVSFFPQLIQGPISRFAELSKDLFTPHDYNSQQVAFGLQRMLYGYFKKMVIADRIINGLSTIYGDPATYTGTYAFVGMLFYAINLYMDFSGGIDIVIGLAQAMGITLPENFKRPYFAVSLKDYWHRWHISLCNWFKDYLFYPISTSPKLLALSKKWKAAGREGLARRFTVYLGTTTVWLSTGIWHGASWNFILWGVLYGVLLMIEKFVPAIHKMPAVLGHAYTLLMVMIGFVLFNAVDMTQAAGDLAGMFGLAGVPLVTKETLYYLSGYGLLFVAGFIGATPIVRDTVWKLCDGAKTGKVMAILEPVLLIAILLLCTAYLVDGSFNPFLYFRF